MDTTRKNVGGFLLSRWASTKFHPIFYILRLFCGEYSSGVGVGPVIAPHKFSNAWGAKRETDGQRDASRQRDRDREGKQEKIGGHGRI